MRLGGRRKQNGSQEKKKHSQQGRELHQAYDAKESLQQDQGRVKKAASRASGQQGRRKCWRVNTRQRVEATETDGPEEAPEKPQKVDQAKVAHQVRQALNAREERHRRALPAREGNQVDVVERVRGDNTQEEKDLKKGKQHSTQPKKIAKKTRSFRR